MPSVSALKKYPLGPYAKPAYAYRIDFRNCSIRRSLMNQGTFASRPDMRAVPTSALSAPRALAAMMREREAER